jgi:hypothetical protein
MTIDEAREILQVHVNAEQEVIDVAYKKLAAKYHPDRNPAPDAHDRLVQLNRAYELLRDPSVRAEHDARTRERERQQRERQQRERGRQPEREQQRASTYSSNAEGTRRTPRREPRESDRPFDPESAPTPPSGNAWSLIVILSLLLALVSLQWWVIPLIGLLWLLLRNGDGVIRFAKGVGISLVGIVVFGVAVGLVFYSSHSRRPMPRPPPEVSQPVAKPVPARPEATWDPSSFVQLRSHKGRFVVSLPEVPREEARSDPTGAKTIFSLESNDGSLVLLLQRKPLEVIAEV